MNKRITKTTRRLKVYYRFNNPKFSQMRLQPEIRLKGDWLKEWGFDYGKEIIVIKTKLGLSIIMSNNVNPIIVL